MDRLLPGARVGLAIALVAGCAAAPTAPAPARSGVYGEVRLVPREGHPAPGDSGYGDRRMRGVVFVDYSRPGPAVVWAEGPSAGGRARLTIRRGPVGAHIDPAHGALGAGGRIEIRNASPDPHVVSVPASGLLRRLEPGERLEVPAAASGEIGVFLLDEPGVEARLFAAPGPYALVSPTGRYALEDLPPGRRRISVWHPRFPGTSRWAELPADGRLRLDLELGVGELASDEAGDAGS